jgi:CubicO group peptidase (beta-lactamase class C family)
VIAESAVVGYRKFGDATPVEKRDAFHLGSCTKSMTATIVAMLVDARVLHWNATLASLFPEFADRMRPEFRDVTVLMLLNQRSGFSSETWPTGSPDWGSATQPMRAQRQLYAQLALADTPAAPPNTKFLYSNRNYIVAGAILEKVTSTDWESLVRQDIFRTLNLTTGGFGGMATAGRIDGVWPHVLRNGKHVPIDGGARADNPPVLGPAGTAHCSPADWAKYGLSQLRAAQGRSKYVSPEASRVLYSAPAGSDYACGWLVADRGWGGGAVLTHAGSNTMNFCVMWLAPLRDFGVLAMTNQGNGGADQACDDVSALLIGRYGKC